MPPPSPTVVCWQIRGQNSSWSSFRAQPVAGDRRKGIALIEAMVAVAIIGSIAVGWSALSLQTTRALDIADQREREVRNASRLLARIAVYSADELDALVGRRDKDGFRLRVSRLSPGLYEVDVLLPGTSEPILGTKLHRSGSAHDVQ